MEGSLSNVLNQECLNVRIWQEDGVFIAECLDIPGCVSEGQTRDEALANIDEAMRLCLEVIQEDTKSAPQAAIESEVIKRPVNKVMHAH